MKPCNIIIALMVFASTVGAEDGQSLPKVDELTAAYQRELLFLSTYKKEIQSKIERVQKGLGSKLKQAQSDLNQLETQWLQTQTNNELLIQKLSDIERDFENKKENKEILQVTLKQAQRDSGAPLQTEPSSSLLQEIQWVYQTALEDLSKSTKISKKPGTFYLKSGEQVSGTLVQLGPVARFAEHKGDMAALYPSGGGAFRVWKWLGEDSKVLLKEQVPQTLQFFLFDNPEKEFVASKEKTWMDVVRSGGLIGWIIIGMGIVALFISILRMMLLQKAKTRSESSLHEAIAKVGEGELDQGALLFLQDQSSSGRVLHQALSYLRTEPDKVEDAIQEAIIKESQLVDRFGVVILVVASVAPLMGLLGTVTGMISTFDIITLYGTGNPKLLSGGISEALVTTMFGLIVAIPALLMGQFLNGQTDGVKSDMEKWALSLCNAFHKRGQ